jgi:hypothetical protein
MGSVRGESLGRISFIPIFFIPGLYVPYQKGVKNEGWKKLVGI